MKINDIEVDDAAVLALLTDEQKAKLTEAKGETDFILYKPKYGERYLYFDGIRRITTKDWSERDFDRSLWDAGFIAFDTPEGLRYLERKRDQHLAKVRLQRWIAANTTEKVDWSYENQTKYTPMWDTSNKTLVLDYHTCWIVNPDDICVMPRDRVRFRAECEDDLKVYFGVK